MARPWCASASSSLPRRCSPFGTQRRTCSPILLPPLPRSSSKVLEFLPALAIIRKFSPPPTTPVGKWPSSMSHATSSQARSPSVPAQAAFSPPTLTAAALPSLAPVITAAPSLQPSEGPLTGGTSIVLAGQNFTPLTQLNFGAQSATNVSVSGTTQIQASSPSSVSNGPVNLTSYFQNGWLAISPDAFSYGPQILQLLPNAGANTGGDSVQIYGYGFGSDATKITVTIGGANTTVQKVENVAAISSSLGLDASYPFSLQRITLQTPSGSSSKADVFVSSSSGSTSSVKSFQYLQSVQSHSKPRFLRFLLSYQWRPQIYLTDIDHLDVFGLQQNTFLTALQPPGGLAPNIGLRGLALTPDDSQLIVADFGAQNIYLLDPAKGTGTTVPVGGIPGFANSGPAPVPATTTQTVFVGLTGEGTSSRPCPPP